MPIISTNAIVLSSLKFGDTSLIVKCFTQQEGLKSYLVRGVLKSKKGGLKVAYFQPLNTIENSCQSQYQRYFAYHQRNSSL